MTFHTHPLTLLAGNSASIVAIVGSLSGLLPPLAALAGIVWYSFQIWESDTVQTWVRGHRHVARRKRLKRKIANG